MVDRLAHDRYRRMRHTRMVDTSIVDGQVVGASADGGLMKVQFTEDMPPLAVPADGVTGLGAEASVLIGTDGKPLSVITGVTPNGAAPLYFGATGRRILGQQLEIDQTVQQLDAARDRLDSMDTAIDAAAHMLVTSESLPPVPAGLSVGAIWQQTTYDIPTEKTVVLGRWVLTAPDTWTSILDSGSAIHAETVSAAVGVFIDAMMENLTVVGAANISEAAIEQLTARVAAILELDVEQVNVGHDIRFTSGGLVFYAPAAQGVAWNDWPNRTPLIAITPTGSTSVAVAENGAITAGITPQGDFHGRDAAFDRLSVAGADIGGMLSTAARGTIAPRTVLSTDFTVTQAWKNGLRVQAQLFAGRTYRVTSRLNLSKGSGNFTLAHDLRYGTNYATSVSLDSMNFGASGDYTYTFTFDTAGISGLADGASCRVVWSMFSAGSTATVWAGSVIEIEDIGGAVFTDVSMNIASPPAEVTWYGPEAIGSGAATGYRPNGTTAIDPKLTVGGYYKYGADMANWIVFPIDLSRLNGATIQAAEVNFTATQNAPANVWIDVGTAPMSGHAGLFSTPRAIGSNGSWTWEIGAGQRQALVGKSYIIVKPAVEGTDYVYLGSGAWINVIYTK